MEKHMNNEMEAWVARGLIWNLYWLIRRFGKFQPEIRTLKESYVSQYLRFIVYGLIGFGALESYGGRITGRRD